MNRPGRVEDLLLAGDAVAQAHAGQPVGAERLEDLAVPLEADLVVAEAPAAA
jgi:hypothetical protein